MNLFSILRSKKLVPAWNYQTHGALWRLLPAPGGFLVGEDRDHTSRTVTFFCIEEKRGRVRWDKKGFNEPWWIGIEATHRNVVFLHEFARPDFPEHKKILALDTETGQLLWTNDDLKFLFTHEDCVYATKESLETSIVCELDLSTGAVLREFRNQPEYVSVVRDAAASRQINDVEFPQPLTGHNGSTPQLDRKILRNIPLEKLRGEIELIEKEPYLVLGYYENTSANPFEQELDQHLSIVDSESGALLFTDVLVRKAKTPVPDLFFLRNGFLFYIKNRNLLTAVKLSTP